MDVDYISLICKIDISCPINLKFCTEHGSVTAVLCAKFQNNLTTERVVKNKSYFQKLSFLDDFWVAFRYCNGPSTPQPINSPAYIKGPPFTTTNATHLAPHNRNQMNSDLYMHTRWPGNSPKKSLMAGVSESTAPLHVVRKNKTERKCKQ